MPSWFSSLLLRLRFHRDVNTPLSTITVNNPVISSDSQPPQETSGEESHIGRKILKNPDSYIDSEVYNAPQGLAPRPRRCSVDAKNAGRPTSRLSRDFFERTPEMSRRELISPAYMQLEINASPSKLGRGRTWSTFGRKHEENSGSVSDLLGLTPRSPRSAPSRSPSSYRHSIQGSARDYSASASQDDVALDPPNAMSLFKPFTTSVPSSSSKSRRESRGNRSTSRNSSPTSTISSRRRPRTNHAVAVPQPAETPFTTPVARQLGFDSPHTFGCPTPYDRCRRSSPPPLPPLDHPELAAVLLARSKAANTNQPVFSSHSNIPSNQLFQQEDPVSPMPSKFGISLRNNTSLPGITHTLESETSQQSPAPERRRTRTVSGRPQNLRRDSAEWNSEQAVSGVTSHRNHAWPAEVSREILRLSLGEERSGAEPLSGSSTVHKSRTRGHQMQHFPHRASIPPSFSPFPSSPQERPPSSLKEPVTLSSGRAATTRIKSSSPSLYRHSFGDFSDRAAPKMAEVKRSLSAAETRHGAKRETSTPQIHHPSSLGRSASSLQTSARRPLLHPYTTISQSRALMYGPSTPSPNGASRLVDEVPATPTPASKYHSDKSRGKRKADDIDTTPPDQKKDGQRATFLIPPETRSQRISNSSHAPSSYHRKRARLSSTSPFATPSQSRPSSIQEQAGSSSKHLAWPSSTGSRGTPRTPSRAASTHSHPAEQHIPYSHKKSHDRRQSMSQVSIPISALVSPHAPSISTSTKFHMRDPRKPPKKHQETEWGLHFATEDEPGSPLQAWLFFIGFILFPLWWIAALCIRVPKTRTVGDDSVEKALTIIDDPQIEHDAKSWRFRCRVMAVVSLFTYIPFIVLVAIFVPR